MSPAPPTSAEAPRSPARDRLHAVLLLLPALVLAIPGPVSVLRGDLSPELTGTGVALILALPAALLAALSPHIPRARGLGVLLAILALAFLSREIHPPSDTLGASRHLLLATTCLALFLSAAGLGAVGRQALERGLVLLSLLLSLGGIAFSSSAGALGNTGSVSEAALPGAVLGGWLLFTVRGRWQWIGASALGLYAAFAGNAPVIAGLLALFAALGISCLPARILLGPGRRRILRVSTALGLALVAAVAGWLFAPSAPSTPESAGPNVEAPPAPSGSLGGAEVRARIWWRVALLLPERPLFGFGPGQFQAAFPPYRDPAEIELSTHQRRLEQEIEVEHAHNDLLQGLAEGGFLGGSLWALFLALVAATSYQALGGINRRRAAFGAASLAILANGLLRAPLTFNPAAATAACALFGALLADTSSKRRPSQRLVPLGLLALLATDVVRAWDLTRHGLALTRSFEALAAGSEAIERMQGMGYAAELLEERRRTALRNARSEAAAAFETCPDSAQVLGQLARLEQALARLPDPEGDRELTHAFWRRVLELFPHRVEALLRLGQLEQEEGETVAAHARWSRVLELDPDHPKALQNLISLETSRDRTDEALAHAARLDEAGRLDLDWLEWLGATALLRGQAETGRLLLARARSELAMLEPQAAFNRAGVLEEEGREHLASALKCWAHLSWAREHAEAGRFSQAATSYRQARAQTTILAPLGTPRVRLELAAALLADGQEERARQALEGLEPEPVDLAGLPEWAGQRLMDSGLLAR